MLTKQRRAKLFHYARNYYANQKYGVSLDLLDEILSSDPNDKLAWLTRGSIYLKMNNSKKAVPDFDRAIEIDPLYAKAYHLRGLAFELAGDDSDALQDLSRAIELDGGYGAAYYSRAALLTKMGQSESAVEDIKMVNQLTHLNLEIFANENNVWRSRQLQLESFYDNEIQRKPDGVLEIQEGGD
jgi:tetratricopeptide (TPR) repeat protein